MAEEKTKIVATIGPASSKREVLREMIKAGLDIVRINFSHGDFAEHEPKVTLARELAQELNQPVLIMQDLGGPKFRLGELAGGKLVLEAGKEVFLTSEQILGTSEKISVNYSKLAEEVRVGGAIKLKDGQLKLEILAINDGEVKCKIVTGGEIESHTGMNLPGAKLSAHALTEKDKQDLEFTLKHNLDLVALSFVRSPEDVRELRELLASRGSKAKIIAKIETEDGVKNFDAILAEADGVIVARGDLGVELPAEDVPLVQKMIIKKCNEAGKLVITATQMLVSMVNSPTPTRAEVSDVANAILDGSDAVMLSEETSLGKYPVEAVQIMSRIAARVERDHLFEPHDLIEQI